MKRQIQKILIPMGIIVSLSGLISSPIALLIGMAIGLVWGNPFAERTKQAATWGMACAIVGLGAGIPLYEVFKVGAHGIVYTMAGIMLTLGAGLVIGRYLSLPRDIACLIASGTAICGGSAIAAISQAIGARGEAVAISMAIVFLLNAAALFIFPVAGHMLDLTQSQFGLWAGLAIHDTSSVVGAALQYGPEATKIATTTKLARALWIIPLAFLIGLTWSKEGRRIPVKTILKRCWFIGGFLIMALLTSYVSLFHVAGPYIEQAAKRLMVAVLFLIGLGMNQSLLKEVGIKPFILGMTLWALVCVTTLAAILAGWITI